ncbi:hypothetical protein BO82DRAFT_113281 [Aspergillus uvarum CBS 121591]|uniref:Uncharacterized protein n=1 Tax=Aspergillus uvarum CBS 121591 TaxID=1448315 RepID=A0A319C285_9EURO|nr:hypothetical protein BO82DRAFT_113281 [Aspergillus uvarum CBS 121591]PYH80116.1 hypothetical protein BO82DRAFT_113281 [Aspergillus uvarum CBS 121591]
MSEEGAGDDFNSLRQVRLSCLHEYIGGLVWVFCLGNTETTRERTLVTSVESMADLRGPLRRSYSSEGMIVQIELERSTIVGLRPEADKEEAVSCHWLTLGKQLPESSFSFKDTAVLAIGSSSVISSSHTMETAQCHVGLNYQGLGPKLRETSEFTFLGGWTAELGSRYSKCKCGILQVCQHECWGESQEDTGTVNGIRALVPMAG